MVGVIDKQTDILEAHTWLLRQQQQASRGASRTTTREFIVTAYNYCSGVTASGHRLNPSDEWCIVAADPNYYPLGTKLYLQGIGEVTVNDVGDENIVGPSRLDIFVGDSTKLAKTWGVQRVRGAVIQ